MHHLHNRQSGPARSHLKILIAIAVTLLVALLLLPQTRNLWTMLTTGGLLALVLTHILVAVGGTTFVIAALRAMKRRRKEIAKADYGQNVPDLVKISLLAGIVFIGLSIFLIQWLAPIQPIVAWILLFILGGIGLVGLSIATFVIWSSSIGKFRMRDQVIANIEWRGDEQVLDVGCGNGLLLIAAAQKLTTGKATGVDIWRQDIESNNRPETVWANAAVEGVTDRIDVQENDSKHLNFEDDTFDIVFSSFMLHHMPSHERQQAVHEMARVLKPGGQVIIVELAFIDELAKALKTDGLQNAQITRLKTRVFRQLSAQKPL